MSDESAKVRSYSVDLSALPARELRDRYHERVGDSWRAEFSDDDSGHAYRSTVWNLGAMVISKNAFPGRRVMRTRERARIDQIDHYHLQVTDGTLRLEADGERFSVAAGSPVLLDLSRPADIRNEPGQSIQAFLPREALDEMLSGPRLLHATSLQGAAAGLVAELLRSLVGKLPSLTLAEANDTAKAMLHLVAASVAPTSHNVERAQPAIETSLLRQACRYIEMHLPEPGLGPLQICAALAISRSALYRLFEPYGGVAAHIMERRLVRIHEAVSDPGCRTPLARIAEDHGFKTAAHFSRVFRNQFGYAPSEARAMRLATTGVDAPESIGSGDLAAWLRPLRG